LCICIIDIIIPHCLGEFENHAELKGNFVVIVKVIQGQLAKTSRLMTESSNHQLRSSARTYSVSLHRCARWMGVMHHAQAISITPTHCRPHHTAVYTDDHQFTVIC